MKSKTAFRHDRNYLFKMSGWILPAGIFIYLIFIPFLTAGLPGDSIFNIEITHDQLKFRLIHEDAIFWIVGIAVGMGLLTGMSLFHFVQDKKETTIFLSIGINRKQLFFNRIAVGFFILAIVQIIPMGISVGLNWKALGNYQGLIRNAVYLGIAIFFVQAFSFLVTIAVSFFSGTWTEIVVYWGSIMSTPTILCYGLNLLLKKLYWGNAWGVYPYTGSQPLKESLLEYFNFLNPILFLMEELREHAQFMRPLSSSEPEAVSWKLLIGWGIAVLLMIIITWYLMKQWRAENAGIKGKNSFFSFLLKGITGFLVFSLVFSYLSDFTQNIAVLLSVAAFWISHLFWKKNGLCGEEKWRYWFLTAAGQSILLMLLFVIFSSGFFNKTERFLEKEIVTEASISYVGNPTFLYEEAAGSSTGRGYYLMSQVTFSESESVEMIKQLQKMFENTGRQPLESADMVQKTVIPYDIYFSYVDQKGKSHIWYYDRASLEQLEQMLEIEKLTETRENQEILFSEKEGNGTIWAQNAYQEGMLYLTDQYLSDTYELTLSQEQRSELLKALNRDLKTLTLEERYFSTETAEAVLMFTQTGQSDTSYFAYHLDNAFVYLTSDYENTLKWLEENQLLKLVSKETGIEKIVLQRFDPYIGMDGLDYPIGLYFMSYCADTADEFLIQKDFGKKYTITDYEEIQQLDKVLVNGTYMSRGGYLAAVKMIGEEKYRYLFLPESSIPSFIKN